MSSKKEDVGSAVDLIERAKRIIALAEEADRSIQDISDRLEKANEILFSNDLSSIAGEALRSKKLHTFLKTTFPLGETLLTNATRLYDSEVISEEQRNKMAAVGNHIMSLPVKVIKGEMGLNEAFESSNQQMRSLADLGSISETLKRAAPVLKKSAVDFMKSDDFQDLKHGFFQATFPIGEMIIDKAIALYNSEDLTEEQKDALNELTDIGSNVLSIPVKVISGELAIEQALPALGEELTHLGTFFKDHADLGIQVGADILESMHPLGGFVVKFARVTSEELGKSGAPKNLQEGLMLGFNILVQCVGSIEKELSADADKGLSSKPR